MSGPLQPLERGGCFALARRPTLAKPRFAPEGWCSAEESDTLHRSCANKDGDQPTVKKRTATALVGLLATGGGAGSSLAGPLQDDSADQDAAGIILEQAAANRTSTGDPLGELIDRLQREGVKALRAVWAELGVGSEMFGDLDEDAAIEVAVFSIDLLGSGDDQTLLRISDQQESEYQYLALQRVDDTWRGLGTVDLWNQKEHPPHHRLEVLGDDDRWLVIRSLRGSGNGFERFQETWHAPDGGTLRSVLSYPVEGHVSGHAMPFDRTFTGTFAGLVKVGDLPAIDVDLSVTYTNGEAFEVDDLEALFTRSASVRYLYGEKRFELDEESSGMTETEIAGIFADDEQGFLRHNFVQLKAMATNDNEPKREWLRRFLARQEESTEKSVLTELLAPSEAAGEAATGE